MADDYSGFDFGTDPYSGDVYGDFSPSTPTPISGFGEPVTPNAWDVYRQGERQAFGPVSTPSQADIASFGGGGGVSMKDWMGFLSSLGGFGTSLMGLLAGQQGGGVQQQAAPVIPQAQGQQGQSGQQAIGNPLAGREFGAGQAPQFSANQIGLNLDDYLKLVMEGKA